MPDYEMGATTCALFLSIRYHNLNPNYIHDRLKQLGHQYELRVLLVQVGIFFSGTCRLPCFEALYRKVFE